MSDNVVAFPPVRKVDSLEAINEVLKEINPIAVYVVCLTDDGEEESMVCFAGGKVEPVQKYAAIKNLLFLSECIRLQVGSYQDDS